MQRFLLISILASLSLAAGGCRVRYYPSAYATTYAPQPAPQVTYMQSAPPTYAQPQPMYAQAQPTYVQPQPMYAPPPRAVAVAPSVSYGGYAGGPLMVAPGQPLYLPNTDIPLQAIEAVVVRTNTGQQMMFTAADVQAMLAQGGRLSLAIPPGYMSGTVTVLAAGRQWTFPFQVNVSAASPQIYPSPYGQ